MMDRMIYLGQHFGAAKDVQISVVANGILEFGKTWQCPSLSYIG